MSAEATVRYWYSLSRAVFFFYIVNHLIIYVYGNLSEAKSSVFGYYYC